MAEKLYKENIGGIIMVNKKFTINYEGLNEKDSKEWIINGPIPDLLNLAEVSGKYFAQIEEYEIDNRSENIKKDRNGKYKKKDQKLTTSQIRAVFTKLKEIDAKGISDMEANFLMLKPLVAYAAGRHQKKGLDMFKNKIINPGVDAVLDGNGDIEKKFKNFVKLLEAVLAYHKANGGKDK